MTGVGSPVERQVRFNFEKSSGEASVSGATIFGGTTHERTYRHYANMVTANLHKLNKITFRISVVPLTSVAYFVSFDVAKLKGKCLIGEGAQ